MANDTVYRGDAALTELLTRAGARHSVEEVRAIARGVLGAAPMRDANAWCVLITPKPSAELAAQLNALKAEIEAASQSNRADAAEQARRLAAVREGMGRLGIDAYFVPHADEFNNEITPAYADRLAWLTGFTGSAGAAVVLKDKAALFIDGRYTIQAREQSDPKLFAQPHLIEDPPEAWLGRTLQRGQVLGYDSWLVSPALAERFRTMAEKTGAVLRPVEWNPIDAAWGATQPARPLGPVVPHPVEFAGKSSADKRREIGEALAKDGRDAFVVTATDSLAWLLNIRGADVPHTPLALGYAILHKDGNVDLFIDRRKLTPGIETHLGNGVAVREIGELADGLAALEGKRVLVDPDKSAAWIFDRLDQARATAVRGADPISLPKAIKNAVELEGARQSHKRDGAAMTRFLHWLDGNAVGKSEIEVSDRLEQFRVSGGGERFRDISFDSISGAGANAALPHYRAEPGKERTIEGGTFYLIDSGAQYLDGTTDITRTIAIGTVTAEMKDRYTRVLKGHITLDRATFPKGTTGSQLDVLARLPLWEAGIDFDHGTGHGIGSYLGVHEGPHRIAKVPNAQALLPGMIVSNEPGYYKTGDYGIRIENLIIVKPVSLPGAEREMYGFESITLCPIDKRPIDLALMTKEETDWLDHYHARVRAAILPQLTDEGERRWLIEATEPLKG
ncbi:MAG TPA: aminopeptidase P family protein [Aliidongia sp.]|nr:aminopeptidase P family protein [Aliidongia sp.]